MRNQLFSMLFVLAAGCGAPAGPDSPETNQSSQVLVAAERPAEADVSDVIGATPGPCGSTRARSALGKTFTPDLAAEIKRLSGASEVNFVDFHDDTPLPSTGDPHRLNVLLNEDDKIILLDCG